MNDLPYGWVETTLGAVADWGSGGTPKAGTAAYYGGSIAWAVIGDLTDGIIRKTTGTITELGLQNSSAKVIGADVVLVAMYGSIGKLGLPSGPMATNQAIAFARPRRDILTREYLFYYLMRARHKLAAAGKGATQQNISQTILKAWPVPIAPLPEQKRIVAAIEEHFSRLDAGVAALERARQNLKRMRSAALEAAVDSTGPQTTPKVTLEDIVAPYRKLAYGVLVPGDHDPDGVPFVRVGDLRDRQVNTQDLKYISPSIAARYPRTRLQGGEVLLSVVGTIGRTAVVPPELAGANTARALAVIPVQEAVEPRYVAIALSRDRVTRELTDLSHEVARKTLNLEDVRRYEIPLPSYAEQLEIVTAVETEETWIRSVEEVVARTLRRADHLRSSILQAAFSGRLVPQDENDQPASALLARIASERTSGNGRRLTRRGNPRVMGKITG